MREGLLLQGANLTLVSKSVKKNDLAPRTPARVFSKGYTQTLGNFANLLIDNILRGLNKP